MEERLQDDWLEARLREEAPYIDDAGFTAGVIQKLPAPRRRSSSVRAAVLLAVSLLASVIAYLVSGGGKFLEESAAFLVAMPLPIVCAIAGICALLVMIGGALFAVSKTRELRS